MKAIDEVPAQLKALEHMSTEELNEFCRKHGQRMKPIRSKRLLQKKVSFMLQAEIFGDLPDVIRQQVYDIGLGQPHIKNAKGIETGTTFTRKWKGETYHLTAVADGFEMNGQKYRSLSGAAMAVTGTQWSGKVFWKVK